MIAFLTHISTNDSITSSFTAVYLPGILLSSLISNEISTRSVMAPVTCSLETDITRTSRGRVIFCLISQIVKFMHWF